MVLIAGQTTTAGGQNIPKLMVMGSSTTSETTINTSTDSSNTVYTMVTVTDAEQEILDHDMESKSLLTEEKTLGKKSPKENYETRKEQKVHARRKYEMRRSREILNEFDELFLENEKRINAEKEMTEKKTRKDSVKSRQERRRDDEHRRGELSYFILHDHIT